jgi:hypothetical protein
MKKNFLLLFAAAALASCDALNPNTMPNPGVTGTTPQPAKLLYWDGEKLALGSWGVVTHDNLLYTKFASIVAFTLTSGEDSWDAGDVKFNPLEGNYTNYAAIPSPPDWMPMGMADGAISTDHFNDDDNLGSGLGDICRLVGLSSDDAADKIAAKILDGYTSGYRLPTMSESAAYTTFVGEVETPEFGIQVGDDASTFLPATGSRLHTNGAPADVFGADGFYWTGRPAGDSSKSGYLLAFYGWGNKIHTSDMASDYNRGNAIRCVEIE